MGDHALAEGLAGLASRVDSLSRLADGADSRALEAQEDRLTKLVLVAIARMCPARSRSSAWETHSGR